VENKEMPQKHKGLPKCYYGRQAQKILKHWISDSYNLEKFGVLEI
jgi:hypothetical protein